jgi:hypothetical protein
MPPFVFSILHGDPQSAYAFEILPLSQYLLWFLPPTNPEEGHYRNGIQSRSTEKVSPFFKSEIKLWKRRENH